VGELIERGRVAQGRHRRQRRDERVGAGRVALSVAAAGMGVVQLSGIAAAAPAAPAGTAPGVGGTPCTTPTIKACVDLSENRTWLLDGRGTVVHGPVANSHGATGHETPVGDFVVQRKDRHHVSQEFEGAKMPYAVFFDGHGRAFHEGTLERQSAGCVRLGEDDAKRFFDYLNPNDRVQIVR
jgi:L,D-transpeptidase-like protein